MRRVAYYCSFLLLAGTPALAQDAPFTFEASDAATFYDRDSGDGSFSITLSVAENPDNSTFPSDVQGFSMSIAHDSDLVTLVDFEQLGRIADLPTCDFVGCIFEDGLRIGIVTDLMGGVFLSFEEETAVLEVDYATVAGVFVDKTGVVTTEIYWTDEAGTPVLVNTVVVGGEVLSPLAFDDATVTLAPAPSFLRGDRNGDGRVDIADAVSIIRGAFLNGPASPCEDAGDVDDDGTEHGLIDTIALLEWIFFDGAPPHAPGPSQCGLDPTADDLDCATVATPCE